jgi:hypothetical protein
VARSFGASARSDATPTSTTDANAATKRKVVMEIIQEKTIVTARSNRSTAPYLTMKTRGDLFLSPQIPA